MENGLDRTLYRPVIIEWRKTFENVQIFATWKVIFSQVVGPFLQLFGGKLLDSFWIEWTSSCAISLSWRYRDSSICCFGTILVLELSYVWSSLSVRQGSDLQNLKLTVQIYQIMSY